MRLFNKEDTDKDALYVLEYNDRNTRLLRRMGNEQYGTTYENHQFIYYWYNGTSNDTFKIHAIIDSRLNGRSVIQCMRDEVVSGELDFSEIVELMFNESGQLVYSQYRAGRVKLKRHRHKGTA